MNKLKFPFLLLLMGVVFYACQKELDFDLAGQAVGTLKEDATGNCMPITVNGVYVEDTALNANHYLTVQVDVTSPGKYLIKTDSVNGYYFQDSGTFTIPGINTVNLKAHGMPVNQGTNTKTVTFNTSTCFVDVTILPAGTTMAVYTTDCANPTVGGNYTAGTTTTFADSVKINANVTTPGVYTISTNTVNGVSFSGTGAFATTGMHSITLHATGTPAMAGAYTYALSSNSNCSFAITVGNGSAQTGQLTLNSSGGNCTGATLAGQYLVGTAMNTTNTVTLNVSVSAAGTYSFTTNTVNGVKFSGTGTVGASTNTVQLTASGTPVATGSFNYQVSGNASSCTFSVNFNSSTTTGTDTLTASINGAQFIGTTAMFAQDTLIQGTPSYAMLSMIGLNSLNDTLYIEVSKDNVNMVPAGTYSINNSTTTGEYIGVYYHSTTTGQPSFEAWSSSVVQTPGLTIIITENTATRVRGSFSGRIYANGDETSTNFRDVTNGYFSIRK